MTKLAKFSLAALGGVGMLMLAMPADAAVGRSKFRASVDEVRRYCERLDESFWKKKTWYGCGDKVGCKNGSCVIVRSPPPPPPVYDPPRLYSEGGKGGKNGGDRGTSAGGNNSSGGDAGGGSGNQGGRGSSAGAN